MLFPVLLACLSTGVVVAQENEDEFSAVAVRYQIREPLGPEWISRDESVDAYLEYSLLPMISIKGGVEFGQYLLTPPGLSADPGTLDEIVLSGSIRYYKATGRIRFFGSFGIGIFLEERQLDTQEKTRDADLGLLIGGGAEWTVGPHFGLELEAGLQSSSGGEPDSVFTVSAGPKFFF